MPISREKIKLAFDAPVLLTLEAPGGHECSSQYNGTEWRYQVLYEGQPCFIYLPRAGHDAIRRLGPAAGDVVEVVKQKRGNQESYVARYPDAEPAPARSNGSNRHPNGNGNGHHAPAPQAGSSHVARCLCAAIDAAIEAAEYARSKDFSVTFLGSDVRAIANSIYINDQQNGGK